MPPANRKLWTASSLALIAQFASLAVPFGLGPVQASAQQYCDTRRMAQAYMTEMVCVDNYLRSQKGNRYDIQSLTDAQDSTSWCEGEAGHGIGTTIKVTYEDAAPPLTLHVKNGYNKSMDHFGRNSRVKDFRLTLISYNSDTPMRSTILRLRDQPLEQEIRIPWVVEDPRQLIFEIVSVYPGSRFTDTCLSGFSVGYGM